MILLIDIGNTRIKWATLTTEGLSRMRAATYANWSEASLHEQMLSGMPAPERVLIANVGGDAVGSLVANAISSAWQLDAEFVHSTPQAGGVRNGYAIAAQLGVDRWLAVIGAFRLERAPVCVANVGTALTVDGVDAQGVHLGGIIVPGPNLAIDSLLKNTSDIASRSEIGEIGPSLFAGNTLGAVHQGVVHMLAAVIERAVLDTRMRLGESPTLYLTGGASEAVGSSLRVPYRIVTDLVLQGLAVVAGET